MRKIATRFLLTAGVIAGVLFYGPNSVSEPMIYTDESGRELFVSSLEDIPEQFRSSARELNGRYGFSRGGDPQYADSALAPVQRSAKAGEKPIILVTSWCGYCRSLENYLNENNIRYTRYDIERDTIGQRMYNQLGRGGVPITQYRGSIIRGFNRDELARVFRPKK